MNDWRNKTNETSAALWTAVSQKLQNNSGSPNDYMHSRSYLDFHTHNSFIAVIIIMSLFLIVTISSTGLVLAFCRKKNTVFALQKCEQESEYELDDMDNTDTEICEDELSTKKPAVRSRTFPCFNEKSNECPSSPSRTPLVNKNTQFYSSNSDETLIIGDTSDHNGLIRKIHRSHTIAILPNSSSKSKNCETSNRNYTTALTSGDHITSNPSLTISMDDINDITEGTLEFLDIHGISKDEDGIFLNV